MEQYILLGDHDHSLSSRIRRNQDSQLLNTSFNFTIAAKPKDKIFIDFCKAEVKLTIENVAYACFMCLLLLSSFIGNTLVIVATSSCKSLRIRVTVYFILSLAISDMLTAVSVIPFYISQQFHHNRFCHSLGACYWWLLGESSGTVASILNLFFIAIDRFIAIRFPYSHRILFSTSRVKKMIACIWIFAVVYPITGIFPWSSKYSQPGSKTSITNFGYRCSNHNRSYYAVSFLGIYIVPLTVMTFTYCMILQIAISQIRAIESTQIDAQKLNQDEGSPSHNNNNTPVCGRNQKKKRMKRKELKATKSVALVYTGFLVCWLPACVINIILLSDVYYFPKLFKTNKRLFLFVWYVLIQILPMVSTMINPLIYSFSSNQFRRGFKSIYHRILKCGRNDDFLSNSQRASRENRNQSSSCSFSS